MSEAKHTPGLWVVSDFCGEGRLGVVGGDTLIVVSTRSSGLTEADARLIAAAPDLLAAAERAREYVRYTLEFFDWMRFPNLQESAELLDRQLSEAVAKAEGA